MREGIKQSQSPNCQPIDREKILDFYLWKLLKKLHDVLMDDT